MTHVQNAIINPLMLNPNSLLPYSKKQRSHKRNLTILTQILSLQLQYQKKEDPIKDILPFSTKPMNLLLNISFSRWHHKADIIQLCQDSYCCTAMSKNCKNQNVYKPWIEDQFGAPRFEWERERERERERLREFERYECLRMREWKKKKNSKSIYENQ